jgi:NAD(P)-dependent dehydrogenase (short-subunit alcohol dehydrogenase family)
MVHLLYSETWRYKFLDLSSKAVVITGGGRGIGRGLARHLISLGASVVINDAGVELNGAPGDPELASRVAAELRGIDGKVVASNDSIADPTTGDKLVELSLREFGRLDAWVNAAAIMSARMLFNMSDEEWSRVIEVNLSGTFRSMRAALRHMRQQKSGRLINLISTTGLVGNFGEANYAASKAGIVALTRVAALEMAKYGVAVNCVAPFAFTRMTESVKGATPEQQAYLDRARLATVDHILPFLTYLISDDSNDISGQIFGVRGTEIFLFSQPEPIRIIGKPGGWTTEEIKRAVDSSFRSGFAPLRTDLDMFQHTPLT